MTPLLEDEELFSRTQVNAPIPDIGEQDPIKIPDPVKGGREGQAQDELLTHRASQDPSQPFSSSAGDDDPPPMQWKTLHEAPPVQPQAPLSPMGAPDMPQAGRSDVTMQQRAEGVQAQQDAGKGFDWARAFFAAGKGDLGAFDAERARRRGEPMEQALKQEQLNDYSLRKQAARDAIDPGSNASLMAQKDYAELMNGRANQLRQMGWGDAAKEFEERAKMAPTMNAVQISNAMKNPRMAEVLRAIDSQSRNALAEAQLGVHKSQVGATIANMGADNALQQKEFEYRQQKDAADRAARVSAGRLRLQTKNVDKKAIEELQNIGAMEQQFQDVEQAIPKAMTGPGTGLALTAEGIANSSVGKALGADKVFDAVTPEGTKEALSATRTVNSGIEQAIAEMKLKRHGASFTASEQKVVDKWAPNIQLGPEDNALLLSALRKYMAARGQQRVQQVYKDTGLPIYLPPEARLPLEVVKQLKAEYEGIDKYDDATAAETVDRVNAILKPYGGRVSGGSPGSKAASGGEPPIVKRAREALADPEATDADRAAAQRILDKHGAK